MQSSAKDFRQEFSDKVITAALRTEKSIMYKVLLGGFEDRSAAEKYIESLKK